MNGEIFQDQLDKEYASYEKSYIKSGKVKPDQKASREVKLLIVDTLIQQEIISQAAERENIVGT